MANKIKIKNKNGFTLIELIIVIAIMAILGAIAIPNFLSTSNRARLKADIQSAVVIDNAKNMYETETGVFFESTKTAAEIVTELTNGSYLKKSYTPQTSGANWVNDNKMIKLDISSCDQTIKNMWNNLSDEEKNYVKAS